MNKLFWYFIFFVFFLYSCSHSFVKNGYSIYQNGNSYYLNDSLKLYLKLSDEYMKNEGKLNIKKLSKVEIENLNKYHLSYKNILFSATSSYNARSNLIAILENRNKINLSKYKYSKNKLPEDFCVTTDSLDYYYKTLNVGNKIYLENLFDFGDKYLRVFEVRNKDFYRITKDAKEDSQLSKQSRILVSQVQKPQLIRPMKYVFEEWKDNGVTYQEYKRLLSFENNYKTTDDRSDFLQTILTMASLGNNKEVLTKYESKWRQIMNRNPLELSFNKEKVSFENIKKNGYDVVMINESHHHPEHRILMTSFLQNLKDIGFKYLAIEALQSVDSLNIKGFPTLNDGFYTKEPNFGNMIREAKKLGFTLISYDNSSPKRDSISSVNIYNKTFFTDPNAKVVIYCGYSHIDKSANSTWLASELIRNFHLKVFTIDQTPNAYYDFNGINNNDNYLMINNLSSKYNADATIYNLIDFTKAYNCYSDENKKTTIVKIKDFLTNKKNIIIQIYVENEFEKSRSFAQPVQIRNIKDNNIVVSLCKGNYIFVYTNQLGEIIYKEKITI